MNERWLKLWREWRGFVVFVVVMLLFRSAIADWNQVPSGSMKPGILVGDRIVVDKMAYDLRVPFTFMRIARWSDPARGDVVTFPNPKDERLFVKRVIGVPGDEILLQRNVLYINGERAALTKLGAAAVAEIPLVDSNHYDFYHEGLLGSERTVMFAKGRRRVSRLCVPTPDCSCIEDWRSFGPITVPEGKYWMMGDNRDESNDSRDNELCFIDRERIIGRAHGVAFSLETDDWWIPRLQRFFTDL